MTKTQLTQMPPSLPQSCTYCSCSATWQHCIAWQCHIAWQQHVTWWQHVAWQQCIHGNNTSHDNNASHGDNALHGNNALHGDNAAWCHHCKQTCESPLMQSNTATKMMPVQTSFFLLKFCCLTFSNFLFIGPTVLQSTLGSSGVHCILPGCWFHLSPHWKSWLIVLLNDFLDCNRVISKISWIFEEGSIFIENQMGLSRSCLRKNK